MNDSHTHHILLLPGFFSFAGFGTVKYFDPKVGEVLKRTFEQAGQQAHVMEVESPPTASIRRRAAKALETIVETCAETSGPVHLIGHSTGGLDARLALTPTAALPTAVTDEVYDRVRSLVSVSTPHFGTPLASTFGGAMGKPLIRALAAVSVLVLRRGRLPVRVGVKLMSWLSKLDDYVGLDKTLLDEIHAGFLSEFDADAEQTILAFAESIQRDQSLLFQLTEEGCDLLNAATGDPDRVRYGSIVTRGAPPRLRNLWTAKHNVYAQFLHLLYAALHVGNRRKNVPETVVPTRSQESFLQRELGKVPGALDNDGIVPCWSQVWGQVIAATDADHLDVVGHYGQDLEGASADWFPSYSGFSQQQFERVWTRCAEFLLGRFDDAQKDQDAMGKDRTRADVR